jgi:hypothetical protein
MATALAIHLQTVKTGLLGRTVEKVTTIAPESGATVAPGIA